MKDPPIRKYQTSTHSTKEMFLSAHILGVRPQSSVGPTKLQGTQQHASKTHRHRLNSHLSLSLHFSLPALFKAQKTKRKSRKNRVVSEIWMGKEAREMIRKHGSGGAVVWPCAACKLLRRRCAQDCIFAPYFPADEPRKFADVHRVFGASNVSKLLQEIPAGQRIDAVSSLVYEANARVRDPVYGCVAAISSLQRQINVLQAQLALAQAEMVRIHLCHAAYLAHSTAATVASTPLTGGISSSVATTPSDIAIAKPLFSYDMLLEHAYVGQPMWSY